MSDPDQGFGQGYIAPYDPSNYSNPGQYAGMEARRQADMQMNRPPPMAPPADLGIGWQIFGTVATLVLAGAIHNGLIGNQPEINALLVKVCLFFAAVGAFATLIRYLLRR
jgi:hypothetical protein